MRVQSWQTRTGETAKGETGLEGVEELNQAWALLRGGEKR
jgi:hypothetical protein